MVTSRRGAYRLLLFAVIYCLLNQLILPLSFRLKESSVSGRDTWPTKEDAHCGSCVPCQMLRADCLASNVSSRRGLCEIDKSCDYHLEKLAGTGVTKFNISTDFDAGSSYSFVYRLQPNRSSAETDQDAGLGILVKILCLPYFPRNFIRAHFVPRVLKSLFDSHINGAVLRNWLHLPCPTIVTGDLNRVEMSVHKVAQMCKVEHLLTQAMIGEVRGRMPETGYEFHHEGLFLKEADGLSLDSIVSNIQEPSILQQIFKKINSSQVIEAAIFDLLIRQRDRNAHNIFINESGDLQLIDNNSVFGTRVSSVMLPATRLHTMASIGPKYMRTGKPEDVNMLPFHTARLDYRCHTKHKIGKSYPQGLSDCMQRIRSHTVPTLMDQLGLESFDMARTLIQSASDLMEMGFEWTLYHGGPAREGGGHYPQEACCGFDEHFSRWKKSFRCKDHWHPHLNLNEKYVYHE